MANEALLVTVLLSSSRGGRGRCFRTRWSAPLQPSPASTARPGGLQDASSRTLACPGRHSERALEGHCSPLFAEPSQNQLIPVRDYAAAALVAWRAFRTPARRR